MQLVIAFAVSFERCYMHPHLVRGSVSLPQAKRFSIDLDIGHHDATVRIRVGFASQEDQDVPFVRTVEFLA